jgi:hypothetical protein
MAVAAGQAQHGSGPAIVLVIAVCMRVVFGQC